MAMKKSRKNRIGRTAARAGGKKKGQKKSRDAKASRTRGTSPREAGTRGQASGERVQAGKKPLPGAAGGPGRDWKGAGAAEKAEPARDEEE